MTSIEIIECAKKFCKEKGLEIPIIPRIYGAEQTLGDILNSIYNRAFREGRDKGWEEANTYHEDPGYGKRR